jgi:hypothetical protein
MNPLPQQDPNFLNKANEGVGCTCGSKLQPRWFLDGYGIPLFKGCNKCKQARLKRYRPDIMNRYICDEPIE